MTKHIFYIEIYIEIYIYIYKLSCKDFIYVFYFALMFI